VERDAVDAELRLGGLGESSEAEAELEAVRDNALEGDGEAG
jgi:hypothetical protein